MPSTYLFIVGTLLLSLNLVRPFGMAISDWFYLVALALAFVETLVLDRKNVACWTHNRFLWLAFLILFGAIISSAHTKSLGAALKEIIQQLYVLTLFISLIWVMVKRGKTDVIVKAFIWSGVFAASIAVVDYFAKTTFGLTLSGIPTENFWGRYTGPLGHPNKLGYFLVITTILSFAWLMRIKPIRRTILIRVFWAVLILVQVFGIYLSNSLTAYLGLLLGVMVLIVSSKSISLRILRNLIPAMLVGTLVVSIGVISSGLSLPESTPISSTFVLQALDRVQTTTAQTRLDIFDLALKAILKNPLVGAGYDQASTSAISLDSRILQGTIHNVLLQILYIGGLFAFIGWLAVYVSLGWIAITTLYNGKKRGRISPFFLGFTAAVLSILLMDQFQDAIYQREKWLTFGLLVSWAWIKNVHSFEDEKL